MAGKEYYACKYQHGDGWTDYLIVRATSLDQAKRKAMQYYQKYDEWFGGRLLGVRKGYGSYDDECEWKNK